MGDVNPCLGRGDGGFPVFGETPASAEPCEGAFHDPSAGDDLEAFRGIGSCDDLERPISEFGERASELGSGIAAIGKDVAQPGTGAADCAENGRRESPTAGPDSRRAGLI